MRENRLFLFRNRTFHPIWGICPLSMCEWPKGTLKCPEWHELLPDVQIFRLWEEWKSQSSIDDRTTSQNSYFSRSCPPMNLGQKQEKVAMEGLIRLCFQLRIKRKSYIWQTRPPPPLSLLQGGVMTSNCQQDTSGSFTCSIPRAIAVGMTNRRVLRITWPATVKP